MEISLCFLTFYSEMLFAVCIFRDIMLKKKQVSFKNKREMSGDVFVRSMV